MTLAISIGDPAGIGADIALTAFTKRMTLNLPPFYIIGDITHIQKRAAQLGLSIEARQTDCSNVSELFSKVLPVFSISNPLLAQPARPNGGDAKGVCEAIEIGVQHCLEGIADGLITCPIHKKSLYDAGFQFPGHTEFLAHLCEKNGYSTRPPVMMLASDVLKTVPLTIHIPLSEVMKNITQELIVETAITVAQDLTQKFGIKKPRLAFAGLNPHAGEEGTMGREEIEIIAPAINTFKDMGYDAIGRMIFISVI